MSERYLQSLAILLAGLFSAERSRAKRLTLSFSPPNAQDRPSDAPPPTTEDEH
ncbi:MAG TPA: hypothetical protein VER96_30680 [Polyangiaceae bacterium]|nr:hypothetical protein [Polyangiaceae bacterium]